MIARRTTITMALRAARVALIALFALAAFGAAGCATVLPLQREHLADPIMSFDQDSRSDIRNLHWIEAREGSTGGAGGAGGGCACN